jgi:predicted NAD/FAD-binding protein
LAEADTTERRLLSAIQYAPNRAYLHRDPRLMPKRRAAWSSWNYMRHEGVEGRVCVSYWMNALQKIDESSPLFVTLNPASPPDPALTFGAYEYDHPQFNTASLAAQGEIASIQGARGVHFAGAWLGYGFHEDGLASGLAAARDLGGSAPWDAADVQIASALEAKAA